MLVKGSKVIITPVIAPSLTLEQRLAAFDPVRHGGEYFGVVYERLNQIIQVKVCAARRKAAPEYTAFLPSTLR